MDNDIEVIETFTEESPVVNVLEYSQRRSQSAFAPAPPSLCQRWTQPRTNNPQLARIPPPRIRPADFSRQNSSFPIISNVVSLSPLKNQSPIISKVESLSPHRIPRPPPDLPQPFRSPNFNSLFPRDSVVTLTRAKQSNQIRSCDVLNGLIGPSLPGSYNQFRKRHRYDRSQIPVQPTSQPECIVLDDEDDERNLNDGPCSKKMKLENKTTLGNELDVINVNLSKAEGTSASSLEDASTSECVNDTSATSECVNTTTATSEPVDNATSQGKGICPEEGNVLETPSVMKPTKRLKPMPVKEKTIDDFMSACKDADNSSDMQTILEKKVKKSYVNCQPSFTSSKSFADILSKITEKVKNDRGNVYVYVAELVDELKARKIHGKEEIKNRGEPPSKKRKGEPAKVDYEAVEDARNKIKIKKLNKTLTKLQKAIKDLESKEVDWDDDGDSTYIVLQRYKARAVKVFDKLCDYTKESKSVGLNKIHFSGTKFPQVNRCVERFINQTGQFPDFRDILELIQKVNDDENLKLSEGELDEIAEAAFKEVGEELQNQRRHGVAESLLVFIDGRANDPAEEDESLKAQLADSKKHWSKINEIINDFAEQAKQKKAMKNEGKSGDDEDGEDEEDDDDDEEEGEDDEEEDSKEDEDDDDDDNDGKEDEDDDDEDDDDDDDDDKNDNEDDGGGDKEVKQEDGDEEDSDADGVREDDDVV